MKIWPMNEYVDVFKNESYWADDEVKVTEVKKAKTVGPCRFRTCDLRVISTTL